MMIKMIKKQRLLIAGNFEIFIFKLNLCLLARYFLFQIVLFLYITLLYEIKILKLSLILIILLILIFRFAKESLKNLKVCIRLVAVAEGQ